nr:hypothetical protein GCM10025699_42270 [Microbacterium flavescens]
MTGATRGSLAARRIALTVVGLVFAVPIAAMVAFSLRSADGTGHDLNHWLAIVDPENERAYRNLVEGVTNSLVLAVVAAVLVLVLLVPAMVLVHLRYPGSRGPSSSSAWYRSPCPRSCSWSGSPRCTRR